MINGSHNGVVSMVNTEQQAARDETNRIGIGMRMITGVKWQCVEFVRRYLIQRYGITFGPVKNVYDLWNRCDHKLTTNPYPRPDDLIFMHETDTGHIGIVTHYDETFQTVGVADQNYEYGQYWKTPYYAYEISLTDPKIFGWIRFK